MRGVDDLRKAYTLDMSLPKFDHLLLPILLFIKDGKEHSLKETIEHLEDQFGLSAEERAQMLPSGRQRVSVNRAGWARTFLKKAEFLHYPQRGFLQITKRGLDYLSTNPQKLTVEDLRKFPEFDRNWDTASAAKEKVVISSHALTPEERIEGAFFEIEQNLVESLLEQIGAMSPAFFERLVVEVLIKMGYGGSFKDAGQAIGKSGDGGIDGIIKEDRLGLDVIYIQAKRWKGKVGRPEIDAFLGALSRKHAKKGIFITTGSFTSDALESNGNLEEKIVLVDGKQLAELMIEYNVGVSPEEPFVVKKIDADYFVEE